ncbi:centrosome-associated protein CEP250 isoform X2 [Nyctibius grandis]|uniref:centrosome-associated protein CEP250 isoform X2 n=1 Tax=Nyctibius grandis TaxID=48427 RepID=UPI0035BC3D0B
MAARSQASLERRLRSSEEARQRQAGLVRQLQAKVLQYRTWCRELEQQVEAGGGSLAGRWEGTADHSLEKALLQVEEEQQRCEDLAEVNALLREQLSEANEVSSALKEDVGKLTADWMRAREELELKESEWRSEHELYDSYLRGEHSRLLSLWRQVVTFRRHFLEMKTATDRDLSELKAEQMRLSGSILVSCSRLNSSIQLCELVALGRPVLKDQAEQHTGQEVSQKTQEVMCFQVKEDLEKKELQDRVMKLSALLVQSQKQTEEKEKTVRTLTDTVEILEASRLEREYEASLIKSAREENLSLQKLIKDITEVVLDESDSMVSIICTDSSQHAESSNILSCASSVDAEHAFVLVQEALARRRGATQALKEELSARQDSLHFLQQQHSQQEEKCRKLQQRVEQLEEECKMSSSHQQHLQSLVDALRSDCANLEKTREELQQQLEVTEQEASRLRQSNAELQLKEDSAHGEKVEQQEVMERARRDQELLLKDLAALEGRLSLLQSELVLAKETVEESYLQRDLLKQEKQELTMALEKAEQSVAELTGAQKQLSGEVADLRVAAAKMSSINEALALDKVQLNKLVLQLEQENDVLSGKVDKMERARISDQEKLTLCERRNEELCAEKAHLEQLLKKAEEQEEELQVELRILAEEKAETQEKLSQVYHQQESASSDLEQLRQESSRQGQALAKVSEEQELLVREKAALEVRLAAMERDREGLSEQLAEARSVKETLESSLFEAQQRSSQLEIVRSQLEMQLHTVTEAKDVVQGEVKCLRCELEAERSLMRRERENMAQELLRMEHQCDNTLKLRETDHEVEINKLLQDLASEREGHRSELQEMLEQWEKEKAETEREHEKKLFDMEQRVATMQAQQEEERTRVEDAKQEVLLEKECEKNALLETLLQTQGELREACQQLEQLRREAKKQREDGQNITEKLQAELQETQSKIKVVENRHKEEIQAVEEEMTILLQQRDALQQQVEELTSQLAASEESLKKEGMTLRQEVASLERKLESTEKQREDVLHEWDRLQAVKEKLVWEVKLLQESVTASETRANTATDMNHCLEQELHSTLSILKIKNEEVETQWEKIQMLQKEAAQGQALQETLTRMTAILSEREGEMKLCQEHVRMLENQEQMHKTALDQVIKDITEKNQKMESQQERVRDLEKQQERQSIAVSKMSKELEEREREIRSQQEQIRELEKQRELQRTAVSKMSKELEERNREIKFQAEKMMILEQHGASQVRNLQVDLDHMKGNLKQKNLEVISLTQRIQGLEMEREQVKSLHASLEHLRAVLKDRESECDSQRDQLRRLQQHKEQQEGYLQELHGKVEKMTLSLSKKDQELESQQKQMQEAEEVMEMQLRTVRGQLEQTLETLKEKDRLIGIQKQQTRHYEEKTEEQMSVLRRDLENTTAILKEKDLMIVSQKELIETFQKQERDSEQQKEILQHLDVALKDKEQEILSLRKQCEAWNDRFHHQAVAEGEQLPWLSEKRLLLQRLECLQQAVERLEHEKMELKQLNAELRRTLEQVERERRRLRRCCRGQSLPGACGCSLSGQHKIPASREEESHARCSHRLAELQNQVSLLQTQLSQERRYKQNYVECCAKTSQKLSALHQELSHSLAAVVREPRAAVLAAETEKLGQSLKLHCL